MVEERIEWGLFKHYNVVPEYMSTFQSKDMCQHIYKKTTCSVEL